MCPETLTETCVETKMSAFGGVAELAAAGPERYVIAPAVDLSRSGCVVCTDAPLSVGAEIMIRITHQGCEFQACAKITHKLAHGIRIGFGPALRQDREVLECWLADDH